MECVPSECFFLFAKAAFNIFFNKFGGAFGAEMGCIYTKVVGVNLTPLTFTVAVVVMLADTVVAVHLFNGGAAVKTELLHNAADFILSIPFNEDRNYTIVIL